MKKNTSRCFDKAASIALGSPQTQCTADVVTLYIDMICERFKDRGIKMSVWSEAEEQSGRDSARSRLTSLYPSMAGVRADDEKYNSINVGGRACMSSEDFANYYRDLRDYKMPRFYSRAEREYEEAEAAGLADGVQESGKPPKKAVRLTIKEHIKGMLKHVNKEELTAFGKDWFQFEDEKDLEKGEKRRAPRGVIPTILAITLSLMLIVCSSVMVSRASAEVSSLEDKIDSLNTEIRHLEGKLEVKNDMLEIYRIATEEYGMISEDYASSRYVDVREEEQLKAVDSGEKKSSWLDELLRAIGFMTD